MHTAVEEKLPVDNDEADERAAYFYYVEGVPFIMRRTKLYGCRAVGREGGRGERERQREREGKGR